MNRRFFLKAGGIGLAGFGSMSAAPDFLHQFANAATISNTTGKRKTLITIFQRGAVDGLNMVVPFGETEYYNLRRNIAIPRAGQDDGAMDLDGYFGLHPAMRSLMPLWKDDRMAIINCAGSPHNTRSHFDAQDYMESGTPGIKSTRDGWLNRVLQNIPSGKTPFQAVSMSTNLPRSLYGRSPSIAMSNLSTFALKSGANIRSVENGFEDLYRELTSVDQVSETGRETFDAVNFLKQADPLKYKPENGAVYPNSPFGNSMKQLAQLIKANVGLEVGFAETGGWDTHVNQGGSRGQLANLLRGFSDTIAAFITDLGKRSEDVVILTMSEFGRTARENGNRGTDHGHANSMFVIGDSIKGGKIYGEWAGLQNEKLNEGRDLAVTTDFRDVFGELASKHLGSKDLNKIFPGYELNRSRFKNFM